MTTFEMIDSTHKGYVLARWIDRTSNEVREFRHEFKRELPIGAVFDMLKEHHVRDEDKQ